MFLELKEEQLSKIGQADVSDRTQNASHFSEYEQPMKINFIISFFNMSIASESAGNKRLALDHASQGYHFALVDLGTDHPLTNTIMQYVQKLEDDISQAMMSRPQPKPRKEEPSARQNDTSYLSGRQIDEAAQTSSGKGSQLKSMRDKSTYNKGGTAPPN